MKKNSIQSLYLHLVKVSPRRKFLISFLLGLFSALSLPPIHFFLILFLTVTGLIWLLDEIEDLLTILINPSFGIKLIKSVHSYKAPKIPFKRFIA